MWRLTICLTALLIPAPLWAQEPKPNESAPLNLPVSLDRIRESLSQPPPVERLKGLNPAEQPTFRVNITEQQKFEQLLATIKWEPAGPVVAGGIYAYEQQERLFPRINNPRVQPYGAFTTGEVTTLAVEALIEKYVAEKMAHVVGTALREQAEREARDEVARAIAAYRAAQPPPASTAPLSKE